MALAIDRAVDHRQHRAGRPAADDGLHAAGHARLRRDQPEVAVAAADGGHGAGEAADERGREPEEGHHALHQRLAGPPRDRRRRSRPSGRSSGSRRRSSSRSAQQYLEFLGPPPNSDVDVYRLGWIGDFVDAINFLDLWTCESGNNNTNWCNKDFDAVIAKAKSTADNARPLRALRRRRRTILGGATATCRSSRSTGTSYPNLEKLSVKDTFNINLLNQTDLTQGRRHRSRTSRQRTRTGRAARPALVRQYSNQGRESSMLKFIVRRIFWTIPVLLVVIFLTFMHDAADRGEPVPARRSGRSPSRCSANLERKFNLDKPW